ncbi:hypothetical protein OH77DRAFT_1516458 [Trametes cingulata]|nr:hypothetical protein OH77DRAFT_1516458 [Trametes cingulata]
MDSPEREYTAQDLAPSAEVPVVELALEGDDDQIIVVERKRDLQDEDFSASQEPASSQDSSYSQETVSSQMSAASSQRSRDSHSEDEMEAEEDEVDHRSEAGTVHMELEDDDEFNPYPATQVRQATPQVEVSLIANSGLDGRKLRLIAKVYEEWREDRGIAELHSSWVRVAQLLYDLDKYTVHAAKSFVIAHKDRLLPTSRLSEADEDWIYDLASREWETHMAKAQQYA